METHKPLRMPTIIARFFNFPSNESKVLGDTFDFPQMLFQQPLFVKFLKFLAVLNYKILDNQEKTPATTCYIAGEANA